MCKASLYAEIVSGRHLMDVLGISISDGGLAAMHKKSKTVKEHLVCVQTGDRLELTDIPSKLRKKHDLRRYEVVDYVRNDGSNQDELNFPNHLDKLTLKIDAFADKGITAVVVELSDSEVETFEINTSAKA